MKGSPLLVLIGMFAGLAAAPACAGTLFKCVGANGVPNYTGKRVAGAACEVIGHYRAQQRQVAGPQHRRAAAVAAKSAPASPSAPASTPRAVAVPAATATKASKASSVPAAAAANAQTRVMRGQVYSYMQNGVRHYSSARPRQVASIEGLRTIRYSFIQTCYACAANPEVNFASLRLNTQAYTGEIARAAQEYGVEEAVVRAVIHAESAFNPLALSRAGAQGLMQLMPASAQRFGVGDAYDVEQNIRGGVRYLAWLLKRFNGDLALAAAGYNAGEGAVARYRGVPPYSETRRYVQRVGVLAERYRSALTQPRG